MSVVARARQSARFCGAVKDAGISHSFPGEAGLKKGGRSAETNGSLSAPHKEMLLIDRLIDLSTRPVPLRALALRKILQKVPIGSYWARLRAAAVERPWYGWCLYHAAVEAKALGHRAMTAIEFGVAGGAGLLCLCRHRDQVERAIGIEILVHGFDTGTGLPNSEDPRDLLYVWPPGSFEMNIQTLKERIRGKAELTLGDIAQTVPAWRGRRDAPIGAIMFDLDLYTSTRDALAILTSASTLPRVWCYFDDISGYPVNAYSDFTGVREAIRQFNLDPRRDIRQQHLSRAYTFGGMAPENWHASCYIYHRLQHPDYNRRLSKERHQLILS